jgi:hypothetical protein
MRMPAALALILSLCVGGGFAMQGGTDWGTFTAPDKSFSVIMPADLQPVQHTAKDVVIGKKKNADGVDQDETGTLVTDIWLAKESTGLYLAGATMYPMDLDVEHELDLDRDNFLKAVDATLVSESRVSSNGFAGREFTGVSATYTFKSRVFADRRHAYQVAAGEPTKAFDMNRVDRFLQSYQLRVSPQ